MPWRRLDPRMLVVHPVAGTRPAAARVRGGAAHRPRGRPHPRLDQPRRRSARSSSSGCCAGASPSTASPRTGSSCTAAGSAASAGRCPATASARSTSRPGWSTGSSGCPSVKIGSATGGTRRARGPRARRREQGRGRPPAPRAARPLPGGGLRHPGRRRRPRSSWPACDWSWLRFAPLSFSSLAGIGIVAGALFNLLNEVGRQPRHGSRATPSTAWPERVSPPPSG